MPNEDTEKIETPQISGMAVKAIGDWELDVTAAPFDQWDSDHQTFDARTDFMPEAFSQPAVIYHHGVLPGRTGLQPKPSIIGKSLWMEKQADGLHIRVLLDKASEFARRVWEAAKQGMVVASSDSIAHLSRLDVGGRTLMYDKAQPGRISVWPLAGISLWDKTDGNFLPANKYAFALPVMKAMYRDAGIVFPEQIITHGDALEAAKAAERRAKVVAQSKQILARKGPI